MRLSGGGLSGGGGQVGDWVSYLVIVMIWIAMTNRFTTYGIEY